MLLTTFFNNRIRLAAQQAHYIALKHFPRLEISAACIAFCEMLNEDSVPLRLHTCAARMIARRLMDSGQDERVAQYETGQ